VSPSRLSIASGLLIAAEAAMAHSPIKGLDSFYAGILHPVFVPAHVLSLLALGILFGQQGPRRLQPVILAFLGATAVGLVYAGTGDGRDVGLGLLTVAALSGLLAAAAQPLPTWVNLMLAVTVGALLGADSAQDELAGRARFAALVGSGIALYLLMLYVLVFADGFQRREWQRIGLRVIASWCAAAALLVLVLGLSGAPA
jgi:hydrogenase/urease accessory protein HupE